MDIRTLLVHVAVDDGQQARLDMARALAERFGAHIDFVFVTMPMSMPAAVTGRGASYAYLGEAMEIAREKADVLQRAIESRCASLSYSWTTVDGEHMEELVPRAAHADLAVVSQAAPERFGDRVRLHLTDRLALEAGCPTLVLPFNRPAPVLPLGRRVLVAWKEGRHTTRALRDALPILRAAEEVLVLFVDEDLVGFGGEGRAAAALCRQGVSAHSRMIQGDGEAPGRVLRRVLEDEGFDLLVMGAHGRTSWGRKVLGSTTQDILSHMPVPVLMSH